MYCTYVRKTHRGMHEYEVYIYTKALIITQVRKKKQTCKVTWRSLGNFY
jgi:hypothetical protein